MPEAPLLPDELNPYLQIPRDHYHTYQESDFNSILMANKDLYDILIARRNALIVRQF